MVIYIVILTVSVILAMYLIRYGEGMTHILLLAFALRLFLLVADLEHWFPILNSGADTEMFDLYARRNLQIIDSPYPSGYSGFLTFIYSLTNNSRLFAQYINVLFGMGILLLLVKTFRLTNIPESKQKTALCVVAFMPNMVIFSSILLREAWVEFFVAASALQFIIWFRTGKQRNMLMCIFYILAASYMHSGVIGLLGGYITAFLAYDPKEKTMQFTPKTIVSIVLMGILFVLFSGNSAVFLGKFQTFDPNSPDAFLQYANKTGIGNSGYLTWLPHTRNALLGLLVAPLRMLYFLFSPLPTEWRRVSDIIGFAIDGSVYMWMCWFIVKNRAAEENSSLKKFLVASVLAASFIFGYGTSNAGTAFRHRAKLMPVIALTYAIANIRVDPEEDNEPDITYTYDK